VGDITARNAANTANAAILSTDALDKTAVGGHQVSVINNATVSLGATLNGFLVVQTANYSGLLAPRGAVGAITIVSDPTGSFSVVAGTGGLVNVYWTGSVYELQNKTGATIAVRAIALGAI
jgi:hypothetical protein